MRVGLHIPDFTWNGGPAALRVRLGEVARHSEQAGVDRISVMDHVWQIGHIGPPEHEMLEAYTTLGWLAAKTDRVKAAYCCDRGGLPGSGTAGQGRHDARRPIRRARHARHRGRLERRGSARAWP